MAGTRPRILLVDDEAGIVKVVRKALELNGFDVRAAGGGKEALAAVKEERPDLIILDIMLPRMSGLEVCQKLKHNPAYRQIPIIIYTGKGYEGDEPLCREVGADAYVAKLEGLPILLDRIKTLLAGSGG